MGNVDTADALRVEAAGTRTQARRTTPWTKIRRHWQYYLMVALPLAYIIIFKYIPMVGAQIAFRDYSPVQGIWGSEWVGLEHFLLFFKSPNFYPLIRNVVAIDVLVMTLGFVSPIILALALNELRNVAFKRTVQMVTYFPHFYLHRGDGVDDHPVPQPAGRLHRQPGAPPGVGGGRLHGHFGRVPVDLRILGDLAALRVRRHHLHGSGSELMTAVDSQLALRAFND